MARENFIAIPAYMRLFTFFLLSVIVWICPSCSKRHPYDYAVLGPEEFVHDSCFIRQGKAGIKELEGEELEPLTDDLYDCYENTIDEDDILSLVVYHPSRRDWVISIQAINDRMGGFPVTQGCICLPDLPPIEVIGLTLKEARLKIRDELCQHLDGVDVFVSCRDRRRHKVDIAGYAITTAIPVDGKMRLYEILALAHLPPDANLFSSYIMRNGVRLNVDFFKLLKEGDMCQNIVVRGGDKIFIGYPTDCVALIMGGSSGDPTHSHA